MRIEKKNYPQVYIQEFKYKTKKKKMTKFIDVELKSYASSDSERLQLFTHWETFLKFINY